MLFLMKESLISFLDMTAWRMETPQLFGGFHLCVLVITAAAAVCAAVYFSRTVADKSKTASGIPAADGRLVQLLFVCGCVLAVLEVYKQLFLYYVVNGEAYDWWFFPFQLCSVPMYLCILLPLAGKKLRRTFITFMSGYTFISAAAALIYPEDYLRSYISLTVHGFLWHGILLFISLLIIFSGAADSRGRGIIRAAGLFAVLCAAAVLINIAAEPLMQAAVQNGAGLPHDHAAMFYLNPYHLSPQPLVSSVQKTAGIPAGLVLYSLVIAAAGSAVISLTSRAASGSRKARSSTR